MIIVTKSGTPGAWAKFQQTRRHVTEPMSGRSLGANNEYWIALSPPVIDTVYAFRLSSELAAIITSKAVNVETGAQQVDWSS